MCFSLVHLGIYWRTNILQTKGKSWPLSVSRLTMKFQSLWWQSRASSSFVQVLEKEEAHWNLGWRSQVLLHRVLSRGDVAGVTLTVTAWKWSVIIYEACRSQWPRGLRRRSVTARLLRMRVRIPPGAWMSVCCECCVLSGWGLCDGPITRPEESYRCVWSSNIMN